ncbi:hypothetical protein V6Z11_A04G026400 [Gossypium hirsutum]
MEDRLQKLYGIDPSDEVLEEIMEVQLDLNLEIDKKEIFWEQQAQANWLKYGDRTTNFFHKAAIQQFYRNRISGLEHEDGSRVSTNEEMLQLALRYFKNLFTASSSEDDVRLLGLVDKCISNDMNEELLKPFTEEDILHVVKSMPPLKALGIDGF